MFLQQMYLLTADTRLALDEMNTRAVLSFVERKASAHQYFELIDAFMKFHVLMFDERHAIVELTNLRLRKKNEKTKRVVPTSKKGVVLLRRAKDLAVCSSSVVGYSLSAAVTVWP